MTPLESLDRAIQTRANKLVPAEFQADYQIISEAWRQYESGADDAAKATLQTLSITSPCNEWKLLIRGLMAYAQGDSARALENFRRLKADRSPSQLAKPIRMQLDAGYAETLTANERSHFEGKWQTTTTDSLLKNMQQLQRLLSQEESLEPAFRLCSKVNPEIAKRYPDLADELSHCLYACIARQGVVDDMNRYRRVFGSPKDDPEFSRLRAFKFGLGRHQMDVALEEWKAYYSWLKNKPPAEWSAELVNRCKAQVLLKIADLSWELLPGRAPAEELKAVESMLLEAYKLAPEDVEVAEGLIDFLAENKSPAQLFKMAGDVLKQHPNSAEILAMLIEYADRRYEVEKAFDYAAQLYRVNPLTELNRQLMQKMWRKYIRRMHLLQGPMAVNRWLGTIIKAEMLVLAPREFWISMAVAAQAKQDQDQTEQSLAKLEQLEMPALSRLQLAAEVGIAKFTPARRKPFEALWKGVKPAELPWEELMAMLTFLADFADEPRPYTGFATQRKQIEAEILKRLKDDPLPTDILAIVEAFDRNPLPKLLLSVAKVLCERKPVHAKLILTCCKRLANRAEVTTPEKSFVRKQLRSLETYLQQNPKPENQAFYREIDEIYAKFNSMADFYESMRQFFQNR